MQEELKVFRYHRDGNVFSWWGGPYIEITLEGNATPYDVYNVWDYEKDEPTIERSMKGLVTFIDEQFETESEYY